MVRALTSNETRESGFIGREPEMAVLTAALDDALSGRGQMVMLAGEPGIGKTRLAQELASHAESLGAQVLWGWCYEQQGAPPYWPWVQPIRSYIQQTDAESLGIQMGPGAADISEIIPEVREKLPNIESVPPLDPQQARFRLFDSISQFLKAAARSKPLLLILDDLQWADQPSLLLLEFLATQVSDSRIMLAGTYRDTEISLDHPLSKSLAQLARSDSYRRLKLSGLEGEYVRQLIEEISGEEPSDDLVRAIYGHTEGNPFFMTEIIRLIGERGQIGGEAELIHAGGLEVPQSVLEVIGQRLNRLSTECQNALTTGAVVGRQFGFRLLGQLNQETSEDQLLMLMDEALAAYLIQEVPGQGDVYQFSHALVQQTLRERLSTSRRVRLHVKIGESLEEIYGNDPRDHAAELAYHFAEAVPVIGTDKLIRYSLLAGERGLETYAQEEALDHFLIGLTAKDLDIEGVTPAADADAASLLFGLGRAQAATLSRQELDVAVATLSRAFEFYAEANDVAQAVKVAAYPIQPLPGHRVAVDLVARALDLVSPDSPEAGLILARYGLVVGLEEGDYQNAADAFDKASKIAEITGDLALEVRILAYASSVDFWHLRWQETVDKGLRVIEVAQRASNQLAEVSARMWVGVAFQSMGDSEKAELHASAGLSTAEVLRDRYWLATARWQNEMCSMLKGDWEAARGFNERGLSVSPSDTRLLSTRMHLEYEVGNETEGDAYRARLMDSLRLLKPGPRYDYASAALLLSVVARITGTDDYLQVAETAAETVLSSSHATPLVTRFTRLGVGIISVMRRDAEAAKEQYDNLGSASGSNALISNDRVLGLLAQTMGKLDQAAVHFEGAIAFCGQAGYKPELTWSCYDYAGLLLERNKMGDRAKALGLLGESVATADELGMAPLLARSKELIERVESGPVRAPEFPYGLTQREVDVVRLVAAGRTDREIADELVISVRTVTTHVGHILNKTGAANRTEAASYAHTHGLVGPNSEGEE